jgi:CheY-like chemotaxis protein
MERIDLRIVIVDDNPDAASALAKLIQVSGFSVVAQIRDTPVAVEYIAKELPHVVMLDIGMPLVDGFTLARRIREAVFPVPRLVAVTGHSAARHKEEARKAGFDAYFNKPVDWPKLEELLVSYAEANE